MPSGIYERKPFTEAHKRNIGKNNVGMFGKFHTKATKDKMAKAMIGNRNGLETQFKKGEHPINEFKKGQHPSLATEFKKGYHSPTEFKKGQITGKDCWNWKGGVTPLYQAIRGLTESKQWRITIYEQDNYTCVECGQIGGKLHAHHSEKSFSELLTEFLREYDQFSPYEDVDTLLRLATKWQPFWTAEGETHCEDCHKLKH